MGSFFAVDDLLHQLVPDHKVGGAGVLVDEEGAAAGEHAFHNSGSLGGGSAGVLGGEMAGVLSVWKIIDKQGNIGVFDAAPSSARSLTAVESVITYSRPSPAMWL